MASNMFATIRYKERIKIFFVLALLCVISIKGYDDFCADYLLSGWNSLDEDQIMFLKGHVQEEPSPNLRLYAENRWTTNNSESYYEFKINFSTPKTLHTLVTLSTREINVRMYNLSSTGWKVVYSETGDLFIHSGSAVPQFHPIPAKPTKIMNFHIHVWGPGIPSLQVELLGCDATAEEDMFAGKNLKTFTFVPVAVEDLPTGSILGDNVMTHIECAQLCFRKMSCLAFLNDGEVGKCIGYETNLYGNFLQSRSQQQPLPERHSYYFYNYGLTRMLDYERHVFPILMYRVYTVRKTRIEADRFCANYSSNLLIISSIPQMTSVLNRINSSPLLSHEGPYYVGGNYSSGGWHYREDATIPQQLWSSSSNNTTGDCVILTSDGLSSYQCDMELFFICAI